MVVSLAAMLLGNATLFAQETGQAGAPDEALPDRRALYKEGLAAYDGGRYDRAYVLWKPLAENGYAAAQYSLGRLFEQGGGSIQSNPFMAALWYRQAAAQDVAAAQNNLAIMYAQGRGVPLNKGRAVELWDAAAANGHVVAKYNLALSYFNGDGVPEDRAAAIAWFREAAAEGVADAQFALGQLYRVGIAVPEDPALARGWYEKAAAQGHDDAQVAFDALAEVAPRYEVEEAPLQTAAAPAEASPEDASVEVGEAVEVERQANPTTNATDEDTADTEEAAPVIAPPETVERDMTVEATPLETASPADAPQVASLAPADGALPTAAADRDKGDDSEDEIAALIETGSGDSSAAGAAELPPKPRRKPKDIQIASTAADPAVADLVETPEAATTEGRFTVWLATTREKDEAERFWGQAQGSYPEIFAAVGKIVEPVDIAGAGANYRLLVGPLPSLAAAAAICRQLRAEQEAAFCIPRSD
ncbi:MAG TPA: SPOR domain-containing protein [Kiloniellaceae bacterium]|nr:SPOR domain-containing protein [Kiloniellaceae bacterium]